MSYKILPQQKNAAKKLGVTIKPSTVKGKKIDVFKDGKKVASIGAKGFWDYIAYKKAESQGKFPKGYAESRRRLYKIRHKDENKPGTPGYYALNILW